MAQTVSPLTLRLVKGTPLTAEEGDEDFKILRDSINALFALYGVSLNPDGTLKAGAASTTAALADRIVTQKKLAFLANWYVEDTGSTNAWEISFTPEASAYETGMEFVIRVGGDVTGATTLTLSAMAPKTVKKRIDGADTDLATGDIYAGQFAHVIYDGTVFQLLNPNPTAGFGMTISTTAAQVITSANKYIEGDHGLGGTPDGFEWIAECIDPDGNYAIGDRINCHGIITSYRQDDWDFVAPLFTPYVTTVKIGLAINLAYQGYNAYKCYIQDKTSGSPMTFTRNKWTYYGRAWKYTGQNTIAATDVVVT